MEKIILAPRQMHKNLLFSARKEDFFVNPKILTKEELLGKHYGRVTDEGISFLLRNKNIIYDNLLQIAPFIPRANEKCVREKNKTLFEWKSELEKEGYLEKDEFFEQFIKNKEFEIYGYNCGDNELLSLLKIYDIKYEFKGFSVGDNSLSIKKFPLIEDEIFYMLNEIARLLDEGICPSDILIYTGNESALFYTEKYCDSFGFKINFPSSQNLYSQESIASFLYNAKINKSFDDALNEIIENEKISNDIKNTLAELCEIDLPFEKKFDYIVTSLKNKKIKNTRYENAIDIVSSPVFEENKYIFIPCFAQNIYPKSYKDNSYISDADKMELNVLTSLEKCRIEDAISKDFVLSNNKFFLSRSSASVSEKYFPSPFVKSLGITEIEIKDIPNTIYSKKYCAYRLGIDLDNKLYYLQHSKCMKSLSKQMDLNYRQYKNDYTDAQAMSSTDFLSFSYSSVKTYYNCPFAYYLDNILQIKVFEDTFYTKLGKVAHYVFEHQYDDEFDFEKAYEIARNQYDWEIGEDLFVDRLKDDIKRASDACLLHYKTYTKSSKILTEKELKVNIDNNTLLKGFVDKIMLIDDSEAILVDYKTGNESFEKNKLEYGLSMQLPTYAYLFSHTKEFQEYHIAGLYINNVINSGFDSERKDDELIDSYLKLNGVTVADLGVASKVDASISNGSSMFIKGVTLKKDGNFKDSNNLVGDEELKQMQELVLQKYVDAARNIRNNKFEISPLFLDANGACKYCEHKDICFVKASQRRGKNVDEEEE